MGKGTNWDAIEPPMQSKSWDETIERFDFPQGEWTSLRLVGDVYSLRIHWIPTLKKAGGAETAFPLLCRRNEDDNADCPCCRAGISAQTVYLSNAIIRDLQEDKPKKIKSPEKGKKFRVKGDKFWSPIRVIKFPAGIAQKIKNLSKLNKVSKGGKITAYQVNDVKYGRDINVLFDPSQSGSGMYDVQKDDRSPLTDEEKSYLLFDLDVVYETIQDIKDIISSLRRSYDKELFTSDNSDLRELKKMLLSSGDTEEEDEDEKPKKGKKGKKDKKGKKGKKGKKEDEEEDELEEDEEDEDEEDEDELEEDEDEEDEDELEEDEDEEDEDELEEDDEKPKKGKKDKKGKKSKKVEEEDEDEEDEDEEDEDEEDELDEKPKKSKKEKSKKSKKVEEEEDDLWEDEEDDEEKPKKGKKIPKSKKEEHKSKKKK